MADKGVDDVTALRQSLANIQHELDHARAACDEALQSNDVLRKRLQLYEREAQMREWQVTFDGSTDPGTVRLETSDGTVSAQFETDEAAKRFYRALVKMGDTLSSRERKLENIRAWAEALHKELDR